MKQTWKILTIVAIVLIMCTMSCHLRPRNVLSEKQMVEFLTDAYQLEGFYAVEHGVATVTDPAVLATYDELFKKHDVTREQFETSIEYYMRHSDKYQAIHKQVVSNLDQQINSL